MGDPFFVPPEIIPKGMTYQWVAKSIMGDPHPDYKRMVESGWTPVPGHRHRSVFKTFDADGNVCVMGQVLMSRCEEISHEAHQIDQDKAYRNASSSARLVKFGDIKFRLNAREMRFAEGLGISCHQYALRALQRMADGTDRTTLVRGAFSEEYGPSGVLEFCTARVPRHRWLAWLFNLILKEA